MHHGGNAAYGDGLKNALGALGIGNLQALQNAAGDLDTLAYQAAQSAPEHLQFIMAFAQQQANNINGNMFDYLLTGPQMNSLQASIMKYVEQGQMTNQAAKHSSGIGNYSINPFMAA